MKRTTRIRPAKIWSVLLAGCMAGAFVAGAGAAVADSTGPGGRAVPTAPCTGGQIVALSAHRMSSGQIVVTVGNQGSAPCVLQGYPTVALAGQGSPEKNKPLDVARQGSAGPVRLAVGGRAATRLSFTPVLGEASGYCASGAEPVVAPSIVVGVAGSRQQLAPDDGGDFALCGHSVGATAFRSAGP